MKYLSLCSGIEAATVAWHPLGWEAVAYSEIERFPSEVLAHHYPSTPNLGDMTKFKEWSIESNVDLLVGGTPCQSFSVAGLRKGLDDPRGNLMLTYLAIADKYKPKWIVWENVPGVLSSNGGKDFGVFLGALGELGYGFAYRILDAQYFGVAQRRRRVFVVGHLGDWRPAAAVLFERYSLSGHPAPSREKREDPAKCLTRGAGQRYDFETEDLIPAYGIPGNWIGRKPENGGNATEPMHDIAPCLTKADQHGVAQLIAFSRCDDGMDSQINVTPTMRIAGNAQGNLAVTVGTDIYNGAITGDVAVPLTNRADGTGTGPTVMQPTSSAFKYTMGAKARGIGFAEEQSPTLSTQADSNAVLTPMMAVRRLTPTECERLQGFPDSYTDIKSKNKPTPDGPRYKALGNSMAVPVMAWIGQRIEQVEATCKQNK
jgi:DNA (cytosine-5)-methyltransferase 1